MPIHKPDNQYQGVNAHLHSYFQQHSGWAEFHNTHITDLKRALKTLLPVGYIVASEQSLQIAQYDIFADTTRLARTRPDVTIYQTDDKPAESSSASVATPTLVIPVERVIIEAEAMLSVVIYEVQDNTGLGKPVTRIELLSPANKPPGSHYADYLKKRDETLQAGIHLIEVDYLHERRSPVVNVPDYTKREANAYPYTILVSEMHTGQTQVYGFHVDDLIPTIAVPLSIDQSIAVDFNIVYQQTFALDDVYTMIRVDYAHPPENITAYDEIDQQRIAAVMAKAAERG